MTESMTPRRLDRIGRATERWPGRIGLAFLGCTSVIPLLAWVHGLGSFGPWFLFVSLPGTALLILIYYAATCSSTSGQLHAALPVAVVAGVVGTLAYDLFRVPFVFLAGTCCCSNRVLRRSAARSSGSSPPIRLRWVEHTHFANGIGFAIAYAAAAHGRCWLWGIAWAMSLETAAVLSQFADAYGIAGRHDLIVMRYAAHVLWACARHTDAALPEVLRDIDSPVSQARLHTVAALLAFLLLWLTPWDRDNLPVPSGEADAVIAQPPTTRVCAHYSDNCFSVYNTDPDAYTLLSTRTR
jgi:hypothetical protein